MKNERYERDRRGRRASVLAVAWIVSGLTPLLAADLTDPLVVRVNDTRGVPGGTVTISLRTYRSRPIKQGRLTVGGKPPAAKAGFASGPQVVTPSPFVSCGTPTVFSVAGDASTSGAFDAGAQQFSIDFSSATATVNASDGVLAYFTCVLDGSLNDGDQFDLAVETVDAGTTAIDDPASCPIPVTPRDGRLRIVSSLSPELTIDPAEVKPGAVARIEVDTKIPFAIESGELEVVLADPAWKAGTVSVLTDARHGAVVIDGVDDSTTPGHIAIQFHSTPQPSEDYYNEVVPGKLFTILLPTSPAVPLATSGAVSFDLAQSSLVAPGGGALTASLEPGSLTFAANANTEDIFDDGFASAGCATVEAWSDAQGHT